MSDQLIIQVIIAWENFLSGCGFGEPAMASAIRHGWVDRNGAPTEEGRKLFHALTSQTEQRSVFRNFI